MVGVEAPRLRALTIALLTVATVGMLVLSMLTNATFGYRFGTTPVTSAVFAAANVIADVWKALGLIVVAGLLRHRHRTLATVLAVLWFVALLFGVASSMGVYVQDRTAFIGGREAKAARLRDVEREIVEHEARLAMLAKAGDAAQIEAEIEAMLAKPIVIADRPRGTVASLSARCSKVDPRTVAECHHVAELKARLAAAVERQERVSRSAQLRILRAELREDGAATMTDPVAELFAWLTRGLLSVRDVGFGFPLAFGLLIELVSAFGPIGVATYATVTRPRGFADLVASPASPTAPQRVALESHRGRGAVVDFVAERTEPTSETTAIGIRDLHGAYARWSAERSQQPHSVEDFIAEFDRLRGLPALRGKIRKFGERYFGIAIAEPASEREEAGVRRA